MNTFVKSVRRLAAFGLLFIAGHVAAGNLEAVTVLALGPMDGRAVVKLPDGKMQVLTLGDTVSGTGAVVMQVLPDKLVVEETIEKAGEPPIKQTVWIFKPSKVGEKSQVQRLDRQGPPPVPIEKPVTGGVK